MKIVHFCAGLEEWNGMANTARQFVAEESAAGHDSRLTNDLRAITAGVDRVCIHGAWLPVLWCAAKRAKKAGAKLIVGPAGSYDPVRLKFHGWKKRLVGFWERRMLRRADVALATCAAEAEWIRAYEPRAKVEITDLKRFFDLEKPKSEVEVEQRNVHVLYLGRRHPLKGLGFLEQAVRDGVVGGSRSRTVELRIVSDHFGEELEKDWEWCDVLCLPTLSENFGRVVAEALERGKRVITTDGAPVWAGDDYGGRLTYLTGYRDGTDGERVRLLKDALKALLRPDVQL